MRRRVRAYRVRPGELELLLLKAALSDGDEARGAWQDASRRIGSISRLDGATYRLLPLLYRNLSKQGVDDPVLDRLKGVYRHSWYANHLLFHEVGALLGSLEEADIDTMVLKGGAVSRLYYEAPGTRPMGDIDVVVRGRQVRQAIELLERNGWKENFQPRVPLESVLRTRHSAEYLHPRGQELDLHWLPFKQSTDEQPFWDKAAIPLELGGTQTRALCPEDQLLHLCVHGVEENMRSPYWAADAVMLIRSQQRGLDWQRLVEAGTDQRTLAGAGARPTLSGQRIRRRHSERCVGGAKGYAAIALGASRPSDGAHAALPAHQHLSRLGPLPAAGRARG